MLNRYQGNTGRVVRIDDSCPPPNPDILTGRPHSPTPATGGKPPAALQALLGGGSAPGGIFDRLARLVPGKLSAIGELETEDIILLLILYLMYRESGEVELLIILGAMFLLD